MAGGHRPDHRHVRAHAARCRHLEARVERQRVHPYRGRRRPAAPAASGVRHPRSAAEIRYRTRDGRSRPPDCCGWFHLPPVIREVLNEYPEVLDIDDSATILRRASLWYERNGMWEDA